MRWHIFCTVIDNYGDIGTAWRLAQQLQHEHQQDVTLFVDDLNALSQLVPETNTTRNNQVLNDIQVHHWTNPFPERAPADVVIEAFACTLPDNYRAAMVKQGSLCINLEYFSCEAWVAGCHGLPSYQPDGLKKWFFFPGITPLTGGLLRESTLIAERDNFCNHPQQQDKWCQQWQIPPAQVTSIRISLFAYENTALPTLLEQFSHYSVSIDAYLPAGKLRHSAQCLFPDNDLSLGTTLTRGNLRLHLIPFLPQAQFDRLLWLCDINFVRGEASLTRAIWTGKPFVWHIYPTEDNAHWDKLNAFIDTVEMPETLAALNRQWNQQKLETGAANRLLNDRANLTNICTNTSHRLIGQPDLCSQLINFVQNKL